MEEYLFETHCHTSDVSGCANIPAARVVEEQIAAGYSGIVITDHFNRYTFSRREWRGGEEAVQFYLTGYRRAKAAAGDRLIVLLGMELTFYENNNDYLVYGVTEEFLMAHPNLMELGIEAFSALARENGLLLFQAHPFRNRMTVVDHNLLDGVEVHNGNPRHDSRNDIALAWAEKFGLLQSSGSDYHELEDLHRGGILTSSPITSNEELIAALKAGPKLVGCE